MEDLTGKQLGQYRIVAPLGEGGMAAVYKAYQPSMERYVALKILPRHFAADPNFVQRFEREAKVIASLEYPTILPVYDFGEAEGYTYLVMRYVEGRTLADLLHSLPLPLPQILRFITQIAEALDYAHSSGIVHRDVKPSNVLVDERGNCLLSDFGLAKVLLSSSQFTASGVFIGTPTYASPEQCLGQELDQRSDIYSLGVILYEMATGRPPFDAETPMAIVIKHIHDPLPPPRQVNPALPEDVERVILKALAKDPDARYQSAGDLARALASAIHERDIPTATLPEPAVGQPSRPPLHPSARPPARPIARRHLPAWIWLPALLAVLVVSLVLVGNALNLIPSPAEPTKVPTNPPAIQQATATAPRATHTSGPDISPASMATLPPIDTPATLPLFQGTSLSVQEYVLPISDPYDVVYDGATLWVLYSRQLVRLELVEAEGRFRVAEQVDFPDVSSLTWDSSQGAYWAVRGSPHVVFQEIDLVDLAGDTLAAYTTPAEFTHYPRFVAWDGDYLWADNGEGTLYKLQVDAGNNELQVIDSYAPSVSRYGLNNASGLAWDGEALWLLVGDVLVRLDHTARPTCQIPLPSSVFQPSWYEWRGLTWDGQYLWVLHTGENKAYRLDPLDCH